MKSETTPTLLRELRQLAELDQRDEQLRDNLRALVLERASSPSVPEPRRWSSARPRLGLAAAFAAAAIGAAVTFFGLVGGAGRASAEVVLRHAAAIRFAPNQAVHLVYNVEMTLDGRTSSGTGDVWVQADANGAPSQVAETLALRKVPAAPEQLVERDIETPAGVYTYDASHNAIEIPTQTAGSLPPQAPTVPLPAYLFDGATVAERLQQLAAGAQGGARLAGQQTIDGVAVDAIEVERWPNGRTLRTTFYFDADSHLLRGFDIESTDPTYDAASWQVRLASHETDANPLPASTFTLNAPADAWVQAPGPAKDALVRLCPANLKLALAQGESLLAACKAATPGLREDELVAALSGTTEADLDAAVKAGQITPAQATQAFTAEQSQLRDFVTGNRPIVSGAPKTTTTG